MRTLARWCFTHRRIVVLAWIAALAGSTAIHSAAGSVYNDNFKLPQHAELRRGPPASAQRAEGVRATPIRS